jgi:hypothetical protein
MGKKSGEYIIIKASGETVKVDGDGFAKKFEELFPAADADPMPRVNLLHWSPGRKFQKPLPAWLLKKLRRYTFASVAWVATDEYQVYTITHRYPTDVPSKRVGGDVACGRLWARLNEVWFGPNWRFV